ncbi:MAG: hypothetical protein ACI96M_000431 [Candidatus Azotimanducaceae bacterium]|jgi:hypothetical protein
MRIIDPLRRLRAFNIASQVVKLTYTQESAHQRPYSTSAST